MVANFLAGGAGDRRCFLSLPGPLCFPRRADASAQKPDERRLVRTGLAEDRVNPVAGFPDSSYSARGDRQTASLRNRF